MPFILIWSFLVLSKKKKTEKRFEKLIPKVDAANTIAATGVVIRDGRLEVTDWTTWMRVGPHLIKTAMKEGNESPEDVAANVMRRLFPHHLWPPSEEDPFYQTWLSMVAVVGRAINNPAQPHFEVVS